MADNQYLTSSGQALHQPAQDVQVQTPEQVNYTEKIKNAMTNKMMSLDNKITGAVVNKAGYDVYQHHKQISQGYEEGKYFQGTGKFDVISNLVFKLTEATGMQEQAVALVAPFARDLIKATNNPMLKQLLGMATGGLLRAESAKKTKDVSKVISKIEAVFDGVGAAAKLAIQGLSAVGGYVKGVVTDIASNFVTNTDDFFATMLSGAGFMGPFLKIAFPYLKQLAGLMKDGILLAGKWLLKGAFSPFKYLGKSLMSWIFKPKNEQTKAIDTQMALVSGMKTLNTAVTLLANVMGGGKSSNVLSKVKEGTEKITEGHTLGKIEAAPTASLTTFFTGGFLRSKYAKSEGVTEGTNVVSVDKYNFNQATEMQGSLGGGHLRVDYEKIKKSKQESKEQQEPHVEVQANKHIEPISSVINKPETELLEPEKEKRKKSEISTKTETKPIVPNNTTVTNVNNPITNVANTSINKSIKTENHVKNNFISKFIESLKSKLNSTATNQAAVTRVTPTAAIGVVGATTRINQPIDNVSKSSSRIVDTSKAKSTGNVKEVVSTGRPTVIPATNLNEAEMSKVSSSVKATVVGQTKESKEVEKTASQTKESAKVSNVVKSTTVGQTKESKEIGTTVANKRLTELSKKEKTVGQTKESTKVSNLVKASQIKKSKESKEIEKSIATKRLTELSKKEKTVGQIKKTKETSVIKSIVTAPFKSIGVGFNNITALVSSKLKSIKSTIVSPFKLISTKFSEMTSLIGDKFKTLKVAFVKSFKSAIARTKDILLAPFKLISTGFSKFKESATSLLKSTTAIITKPFKAVGTFTKSAILKTANLFTKTQSSSATPKNKLNASHIEIDTTSLIESSKGAVKSNKFAKLFKKSKELAQLNKQYNFSEATSLSGSLGGANLKVKTAENHNVGLTNKSTNFISKLKENAATITSKSPDIQKSFTTVVSKITESSAVNKKSNIDNFEANKHHVKSNVNEQSKVGMTESSARLNVNDLAKINEHAIKSNSSKFETKINKHSASRSNVNKAITVKKAASKFNVESSSLKFSKNKTIDNLLVDISSTFKSIGAAVIKSIVSKIENINIDKAVLNKLNQTATTKSNSITNVAKLKEYYSSSAVNSTRSNLKSSRIKNIALTDSVRFKSKELSNSKSHAIKSKESASSKFIENFTKFNVSNIVSNAIKSTVKSHENFTKSKELASSKSHTHYTRSNIPNIATNTIKSTVKSNAIKSKELTESKSHAIKATVKPHKNFTESKELASSKSHKHYTKSHVNESALFDNSIKSNEYATIATVKSHSKINSKSALFDNFIKSNVANVAKTISNVKSNDYATRATVKSHSKSALFDNSIKSVMLNFSKLKDHTSTLLKLTKAIVAESIKLASSVIKLNKENSLFTKYNKNSTNNTHSLINVSNLSNSTSKLQLNKNGVVATHKFISGGKSNVSAFVKSKNATNSLINTNIKSTKELSNSDVFKSKLNTVAKLNKSLKLIDTISDTLINVSTQLSKLKESIQSKILKTKSVILSTFKSNSNSNNFKNKQQISSVSIIPPVAIGNSVNQYNATNNNKFTSLLSHVNLDKNLAVNSNINAKAAKSNATSVKATIVDHKSAIIDNAVNLGNQYNATNIKSTAKSNVANVAKTTSNVKSALNEKSTSNTSNAVKSNVTKTTERYATSNAKLNEKVNVKHAEATLASNTFNVAKTTLNAKAISSTNAKSNEKANIKYAKSNEKYVESNEKANIKYAKSNIAKTTLNEKAISSTNVKLNEKSNEKSNEKAILTSNANKSNAKSNVTLNANKSNAKANVKSNVAKTTLNVKSALNEKSTSNIKSTAKSNVENVNSRTKFNKNIKATSNAITYQYSNIANEVNGHTKSITDIGVLTKSTKFKSKVSKTPTAFKLSENKTIDKYLVTLFNNKFKDYIATALKSAVTVIVDQINSIISKTSKLFENKAISKHTVSLSSAHTSNYSKERSQVIANSLTNSAKINKSLSDKIVKSKEINIGNATVANELSSKIIKSKLERAENNNSQLTKINTTKSNKVATVVNNKESAIIKSIGESFKLISTSFSKLDNSIMLLVKSVKSFKKTLDTNIANKHVNNLVSSKIATHAKLESIANNSKIAHKESKHSDIFNAVNLKSTVTESKFNQINGLTNTLKDTTSKSSVVVLTQLNKLKDSIKSKILKVKDIMLSPFKLISAGVSKLKEKSKLILTTITKPFTAIKSVVKSGFSKVSGLFSNTDKYKKYKLTNSNIASSKTKQQILNSNESLLVNSSKSHKHYNNVELLKATESNLHASKLHQLTKLSAESNNETTKSALNNNAVVNSNTVQSASAINSINGYYVKSKEFNKDLIASNLSSVKHSAATAHSTDTKIAEKIHTNATVGHKINTKESILTNSIESAINAINSEINSDKFIKFAKSIIISSLRSSSNILKSAVIESNNLVNSSTSYFSKLAGKPNVISKSNNTYSHLVSKESQYSTLNATKIQQSQLKTIESNLKESINTRFKESSKEAIATKIENANKSNSIISRALKSISVGFKSSISKLTSKLKLDKLNNAIKLSFMKIGSVVTSIGSKIKNSKLGKAVTNTIAKWKEKFNEGVIIGRAIGSTLMPIFKDSSKLVINTVIKSIPLLVSNISAQFKSITDKLSKAITKDLPDSISKVISNNTVSKEISQLLANNLSKSVTAIAKISDKFDRVVTGITHESKANTVDLSEFSDILNINQTSKSFEKSNKLVKSVNNNTVKSAKVEKSKESNASNRFNTAKSESVSKLANTSINKSFEKSKEKIIDNSVKDLTVAINKSITKSEKTKVSTNVATVKLMHASAKILNSILAKDSQISKFTKQTVSSINRLVNALTKRSGLFGWLSSLFGRSNSKKDNSASIFKRLANSIAKSFRSLKTIIASPFKSIARGFTKLRITVAKTMNSIKTKIVDTVTKPFKIISNGFSKLKTTVAKTMNSIKTKIVDTVTKPFKLMKSAYVDLKKSISNKVTAAVNSVKDKYNKIVDKSKEFILKAKQSSINLMKSAKDKFSLFATGFSSLFGSQKSQKIIKLTADKTISNSDNIVVKASNVELKESNLSKIFSNIGSKVKSLFSFGKSNESKETTSKSIISRITDKFKSFKMPKLVNPLSGLFGKTYSFDIKQADITATTVNVGSKSFLGKILSGLGSLVTGTLLLPFKMIGALFGGGNRKLIKISTELNKKFEVALLKLHQLSTTVSTLSKHIIDKDKVSIFDRIKSFAKLGLTKIANSKIYQKSKAFVSNIKDKFIGSSNKTSAANNVNISKLVTNNAKATDKLLQAVKSESKYNSKEKLTGTTKVLSVVTNAIKTLTAKVESNVKSRSERFKTSKIGQRFKTIGDFIDKSSEKLVSKFASTKFGKFIESKFKFNKSETLTNKFISTKIGQRFKTIGDFIDKSSEKLVSKFASTKFGKFIESKFKFNKSETQSVNSTNKLTGKFNSKYSTLSTGLINSNNSNKLTSFKSKLSDINKTNIDLNHSVSSNNIKTAKYDSIIKPLVSAFNSFASTIRSLIKIVKSTEFNSKAFTQFTKSNKLSKVITGGHEYSNTGVITNLKSANNVIKSERNLSKSGFATTKLATNLNSVNNTVKTKSNLSKSAFVRVATIKRNEATTNEHTSNVKSSRSEFFNNLADKMTSFSNITKTNNVAKASTSKESELTASKLTKSFTKAIESTQEKESFRQKVLERRQEQREIKREQRANKLLEGILKNTKHAKTTKKSEDSFLSKIFNFGKKLLFGPLGKILGLLGTGFALFKTLGGSIVKSLFNVSKFIGSFAISGLFKFIKTLTSSLKSVGKFLWKGALKVGSTLATVVGSALSGLKSIVGKVASSVTKIVSGIWSATKTAATTAAKGTKHVVGKVWNATKTVATKTWDGAKFLANKISAMFKGSAKLVKSKLSSVFTGTKEIVSSAFKSISTASKSILDSIKSTKVGNAAVNTTTKAWSSVKLVTTKITEMFKGASQLVQTKISSIFSGAKSLFSNGILNTITLSAKSLTTKLSGIFKGTSELVRSNISNIFSGAKSLFSNGIIDAVTLSAKTITSKIGNIFNGVADLFKSGLQGMFKGLNTLLKGLFAGVFTKLFDAFKITKPSWLTKLTGNKLNIKQNIKTNVNKFKPDTKTNVKPDVSQNINPNKFKTSETKAAVKPKEVKAKAKVHETKVKPKPKVAEVKTAGKTNIHEAKTSEVKSKFKTNISETKATVKPKVSEVNAKFKTASKTANKVNASEVKSKFKTNISEAKTTVKSKVSEVKLNTKTSVNASKINNSVIDSKTGWFKKVEETVVKPIKKVVDKSKQTVKKVAEHVVTPIKKVVDKSKQTVKKVAETVTQTVKKVTEHTVKPIKKVVETAAHNSKTASTILSKSAKVAKVATKGAKLLGGSALKIVGKVATPAFLMYDMYDKGFNVKDTFGVDTQHSTWDQRAAQMTGAVANSLSLGLLDTKDFAKNLNVTLNAFKGLYSDSREDHIKKAPKIKLPYYLKVYDYNTDTKTYILKDTKNGIMVYRRGNVYQIGKKYYNVAQGESILEAIGADKKLDAQKAQDIYKHILIPSVTSVLGASKYGYSYVAQYKNVKIPYGYSLKDKTYRIYGKSFDSIQSARKFLIQTMRYQLGLKSKVTQKEATKHSSINTTIKLNKKSESNAATVESINVIPTKDIAFMKSMTAEQLSEFKSKSEKEQTAIYDKWKSEHESNVNAVVVPLVNQTSKNTKVANAKFNQIVKEASHNNEFIKSLKTKNIQFDKLSDQDKVKYYKTWYKNKLQQKQQAKTNESSSGWFASIITKAKQLVSGAKKLAVKTKESAKKVYHKVVKIPIVNKSFDFVKTMAKTAASTIVLPIAASANMSMHSPSNNTTIQTSKYQQSNEYDKTIEPRPAKLVIKKYKTPKGHIQLDLKAPFNVKDLRHELIKHEGEVLHVYKDSLGYPTIGTGHLLPPKGIALKNIIGFDTDHITKDQNQTILNYDIARTATGIYSKLPWLAQQPDDIQIALNDMAFNVGVNGLLNFKKTLSYIKTGNYEAASKEVINSKWAKQVGSRSKDVASRIEKVSKSIPKKNIKTHIDVGPDVENNTNVELNENTENNVNSFKGANSIWDILHPQKAMTSEENNTESSSLFEWPTFNFSFKSIFDKLSSFVGFSSKPSLLNNTESTLGTNLSINPNSNTLLDFNTSSVIDTTHKDLKQIIKSKAAQVAESRNSQTKEKSTETRNPQNPVVYNVFQKMEVNNTNSTVANSSNTVTNVHGQGSPGASYRTDYH